MYNNFFKALRTVNICIFKNLSQIIQIMCSVLDSNVSLLDVDLISIFSLAAWNVQKSSRLLNGNLFPTDFDFFNWPRTPSKCSPESRCLRLKLRRTKKLNNFISRGHMFRGRKEHIYLHLFFGKIVLMFLCHYVRFSRFYWHFEILNRKMGY